MAKKDAYPREFKDRAVALYRSSGKSMDAIAKELGISATSLANWNRQASIDAGEKPGIATDDRAEVARLRRDNRRLELENEILKKAAAYFARENVLPKGLTD
ncbi:transposase [Microcella pacifica]|uniref:Transposase n=1 Tax=Microcella pacifica TaxID=2591847 RepID=A0A9E5MIN4_9MICO|nr:transposase [Microcella pacifica]NHF64040.1 transposase [Microcella pacifica]